MSYELLAPTSLGDAPLPRPSPCSLAPLTRPQKRSRSWVASCSRRSQSWPRSSSFLHTIFFCMRARRYWLATRSSLSVSRSWAGESC